MGGQGDSRSARPTLYYPLTAPDGSAVYPIRQDGTEGAWRWNRDKTEQENYRIEWIRGRKGWTLYDRNSTRVKTSRAQQKLFGHMAERRAMEEKVEVEVKAAFPLSGRPSEHLNKTHKITSKNVPPLLQTPVTLFLDSFAGSGTTGAVAHKMGRRWIMVELGEHCHTHIILPHEKSDRREDPAASPRPSAGKAAAGSAIIGWPPRFWKRTSGATGSSARNSMLPCWPKRSANSKGSPMPRVTPSIGSTDTRRSGTSSTSRPRASAMTSSSS